MCFPWLQYEEALSESQDPVSVYCQGSINTYQRKELANGQKYFFSFYYRDFHVSVNFKVTETFLCHLAFIVAKTTLTLYKLILSLGHLDSVHFLQCVMLLCQTTD